MSTIYHLTQKRGSKKYTVALLVTDENICQATAEKVFSSKGHYMGRGTSVEWTTVCNQKMWSGYDENIPQYGDAEVESAFTPQPEEAPKVQDAEQEQFFATDEDAAKESYLMVEGEGAAQYTFLPAQEAQLCLF